MSWKMAIIGSGFGGLLFGIAALRTKGLALPIGLHLPGTLGNGLQDLKTEQVYIRSLLRPATNRKLKILA